MRGKPDELVIYGDGDEPVSKAQKPFKYDFDLDAICEQAVSRARRNIRIADDYDEPVDIPFGPHPSWEVAEIVLMSALAFIAAFGGMWIYDLVIR